ncbi:glycosyltransferase [Tenacibaculum holothuriorum]|uniref:Glycosyltransferase n=1 Tax=Tenacibaculum holothuriorum TaxID=1635173 RepID=A0A1Y2PBB2_9FLAO|nr:glycosyltransferase family 39 protein [Tenacibaculum holothuriorum]OSY87732.1 glycosyltransferase [Tenacibaculum holothuriorum]
MNTPFFKKHFFTISVLLLILLRLVLNSGIPLMDKTEARYAEIARIMAETNDYITPQIDYNVPFWAKPPLSTWLSALSIEIFGSNEFAVRLPYLILSIIIIFLIGKYAKREDLPFYLPGFIALTIPEFLIHAGVVSTDTSLMFCVSLVMLSFWEGMHNNENKIWKHLAFVGIGLGLLAKGPIVLILTLPPIFFWSLYTKSFFKIFKQFNFFTGIAIIAIIALPWYYLAEQKTPGFIDYFIVGEHFKRFFDSSWSGDKYGFPKQQPLGMIWLFLLAFALPWIQVIIGKIWKHKTDIKNNSWVIFLFFWLLWTPIFFTISKSLIHPYIMPIMVPIALLVTHFWKNIKQQKLVIGISLVIPILALFAFIYGSFSNKIETLSNTDKYLIEQNIKDDTVIYFHPEKSYSSQFYSKGKIKNISEEELIQLINNSTPFYLVLPKNQEKNTLNIIGKKLIMVDENKKNKLFRTK